MDESLSQGRETSGGASLVFEPRAVAASARRWAFARGAELACAALLAFASVQMLAVVARKSITADEIVLLPAAYYTLADPTFQLANAPSSPDAKVPYQESFWERNPALFDSLSFWPRLPMIALTCALGLLVFLFARELFGPTAAVIAVALFSLEPTVLAHGRVVQ